MASGAKAICESCGAVFPADRETCPADGAPLHRITDPMLGTEVGRYVLVRRLGKGAMGSVYLGLQPVIKSRVALKILNVEAAEDPNQLDRFLTEARAVNEIHHPNIVQIIDLDAAPDGRPYILMEYLEGETLDEWARAAAPLDPGAVREVVIQVLDALEAAHRAGYVHRDLKPANIFVTREGRVKLLDFGIAKLLRGPGTGGLTLTGTVIGTPLYLAPEQAAGRHDQVSPQTDLYSFGVILYRLFTGDLPYQATSHYGQIIAHVEQDPTPPRERNPKLPKAIEELILGCLAKEPAARPASAAALKQAYLEAHEQLAVGSLDTVVWSPPPGSPSGDPIETARTVDVRPAVEHTAAQQITDQGARRPAPARPMDRPSRRRFWRLELPLFLALAVLAVVGVVLMGRRGDAPRAPGASARPGADATAPGEHAARGARPAGRLVVLQQLGTESLDPLRAHLAESINVLSHVYEPLVVFDPVSGRPRPWLAESWTTEGSLVTLRLRQGVRFHDGAALTAGVVVTVLKKALKSEIGRAYFWDVTRVEARGSRRVAIRLARPSGSLLTRLSLWPAFMKRPGRPHPLGTGPYRIKEYNAQLGSVVLEAAPSYWGPPPRSAVLAFRSVPDAEARINLLRQGDGHVAVGFSHEQVSRLQKEEALRVFHIVSNMVVYLYFNTQKPWLADPRVRRVLAQALDVDRLVKELYRSAAQRATSSLPTLLASARLTEAARPPVFDPKKARALLRGKPISRRVLKLYLVDKMSKSVLEPRRAARILAEDLRRVGLRVEPVFLPIGAYMRACQAGRHDLTLRGWELDYPDPENVYFLLTRKTLETYNFSKFVLPEFDRIFDQAGRESDPAKRRRLFNRLERLVWEHQPWLPLVTMGDYVVVRREVRGLRVGVDQLLGGASLFLRNAHLAPVPP